MDLPRVTTLKVVTNEIALCLPSEYLQSILILELGKQVWVGELASSLRHFEIDLSWSMRAMSRCSVNCST